jgi:predicted nucleic acid-binding protein
MTVVVADSSPLNYLTLVDAIDVLPRLYGRILVPEQVIGELTETGAPDIVRLWTRVLPDWIEVRSVTVDARAMAHLDPGERAAIVLAEVERDALLLMDDAAGRMEATRRGIPSTGTLGVLRAAAEKDWVDLPAVLGRLRQTNFRVSPELIEALLTDHVNSRRQGPGPGL